MQASYPTATIGGKPISTGADATFRGRHAAHRGTAGGRCSQREGDSELAELFGKAQADSRKGAEFGKQLLRSRLSG
ncbi:hypothetical protein [Streptomyces rishiriensis]|uniref:Uncharacterized protein n=1 Tax=Streptomyces rishiriensis TaxID=68264 RepID=A0ABU0P2K1_STRRH|nr:hypothetical protein [Streptomyces rishiriensis]MDQ0585584.1 hypothetical protein [Streptomyces rishiriensis]